MESLSRKQAKKLQELIHRKDKVLAVMHPPAVTYGRIMEMTGCEAGFVGTNSVVGSIMGLADVGTMTMTECVTVGGWFAQGLSFPIILDGDTGHGGIMAVRRLVTECIRAGIAGIRIDDQPIETKRRTKSAGIEVVDRRRAIARYRAAVDMKNELNPDFVVMAQCYARDAVNSSFEDCVGRLKAYQEEAGVDWVQIEAPHSIEEIKKIRSVVKGPFSFMRGRMKRNLTLKEHLELGVNIAWFPSFTHHVLWAALWDFMNDFKERDVEAWEAFLESRKDRPYPHPRVPREGESIQKQQELEIRYLGEDAAKKYQAGTRR